MRLYSIVHSVFDLSGYKHDMANARLVQTCFGKGEFLTLAGMKFRSHAKTKRRLKG